MLTKNFQFLAVISALSACGQKYDITQTAAVPNQKDTFQVKNLGKEIDVLFVMDNSVSMAQEQEKVVASFTKFLEGFVKQDVDFHIGVISTDTRTPYISGISGTLVNPWAQKSPLAYENFPNAGRGSLLFHKDIPTAQPFITRATQNPIATFQKNALLGLEGSPAETGLLATIHALSPYMLSSWNKGFLRGESLISVIIVADEDEADGDFNPSNSTFNTNKISTNSTKQNYRISEFTKH